ncbi:hypothetical protein DQW77_13125 [Roseovarius sp. TE539]|nr:hypothetical protein DQW77_13125 [Roseovarius sp. TE539]
MQVPRPTPGFHCVQKARAMRAAPAPAAEGEKTMAQESRAREPGETATATGLTSRFPTVYKILLLL